MKPSTDDLPQHAALKQFPVQDDCLQLGGVLLTVVFQSGAYGLTASPTAFPGHPAPLEVPV